jgi:hypothetical protein
MLGLWGCEVYCAASAERGLKLIVAKPPEDWPWPLLKIVVMK